MPGSGSYLGLAVAPPGHFEQHRDEGAPGGGAAGGRPTGQGNLRAKQKGEHVFVFF